MKFMTSLASTFALLGMGAANIDNSRIGFGASRLTKEVKLQAETSCDNVEVFYYKEAVIDNFAPIQYQQHWEGEGQRYWLNKQFWSGKGGNIIVYIGGEGQESCSRLTSKMYAYTLAQEQNALLVNVEHRFYGESYPTKDMSTANLRYLSSQQALADLARIIQYITEELDTVSSKVMTVGGSYPGNMAAWFKLKYPEVVVGSIASSAPLTAKTNFYEYMEVVANSINYFAGGQCNKQIAEAAEAVMALAADGPSSAGFSQLEVDFKTCNPMGSYKDLTILLSDLMGNVQGTIQYNNEHNGVMNVTNICDTMTQSEESYDNFVQLSALYRQANGQECEDASWADTVAILSSEAKDPNNNGRPWTYQTCNEFGYFQTTDSPNQPFHSWKPLNLDFYMDLCAEAFAPWSSEPQVKWMNQVYGDIHISGTDILFPAGTIDPWHALGVTNSTPALAQSTEEPVYILGTAHCADLYAPANSDPQSLTSAREIIANQVNKWFNA